MEYCLQNLHDAIDYARDTTNGIKEIWVAEGRYVPGPLLIILLK